MCTQGRKTSLLRNTLNTKHVVLTPHKPRANSRASPHPTCYSTAVRVTVKYIKVQLIHIYWKLLYANEHN